MKNDRHYDLDERLIAFALLIIELVDRLPVTLAGRHMACQLVRSGTAPALHYGEAHAAESRKDFAHKMKTALKELRETYNALKIVRGAKWVSEEYLAPILDENNQLISIFVASLKTTELNNKAL